MNDPKPDTIKKLRYVAEHPGLPLVQYAEMFSISRQRVHKILQTYKDYPLTEEEKIEVQIEPQIEPLPRAPTRDPMSLGVPEGYKLSWARDYSWCNIYVQTPFVLTLIGALFGPTQAKINQVIKFYEERIRWL